MKTLSVRHGIVALLLGAATLVACAGSNTPEDVGPPPPPPTDSAPPATTPAAQTTAAPVATQTAEPVVTAAPTAEPTAAPTAVASAAPTSTVSQPAGAPPLRPMSVGGPPLEDPPCKADGLGMLGSMIVVGSIAKKKAALNACGKGKPRATWTATKGAIGTVTVKADNNAKMEACVAKALKGTAAPFEGECAATLVLGK